MIEYPGLVPVAIEDGAAAAESSAQDKSECPGSRATWTSLMYRLVALEATRAPLWGRVSHV